MYSENMVLPPASDAMNKDDGKNTYKNYYTLLSSYICTVYSLGRVNFRETL
jgi:hypothetical protein